MLNEQLTCMTLYSHIDQPGLSWRTRHTQTITDCMNSVRLFNIPALREFKI
jgi:hypothetical protein